MRLAFVACIVLLLSACGGSPLLPTSSATYAFNGTIAPGDAERFVQNVSTSSIVSLDSPGGDVKDAMIMAHHLRETGAAVVVKRGARCSSACVLMLVAAQEAEISGRVGVHRPMCRNRACSDRGQGWRNHVGYIEELGGHPDFTDLIWGTPHHRIRWLSDDEIALYVRNMKQ